jgi:hypothetical protein
MVMTRSSAPAANAIAPQARGIQIERIKPRKPQQNGRHERMYLTLKKEAIRTAGMNARRAGAD